MPRLSLYRPEKSSDYKFIDRSISEMFQVGATDVYFHRYIGPKNPSPEDATADQPHYDVISETNVQDLLFLENRDRKYDSSIYRIRGHYMVQELDFNLSQFGLFLENDTVFMTVHINDFIKTIGRKPISGDVVELPHLRDEFALGNADYSLPRFFVVSDVSRAAEGFSATWYPHLYRIKLTKISDEAQFSDVLVKPADEDANFVGDWENDAQYSPGEIVRYQGKLYSVIAPVQGITPPDVQYYEIYTDATVQDLLSTKNANLEINDALLNQAEADAAKSGYDTQHYFTLAVDNVGNSELVTSDKTDWDASITRFSSDERIHDPLRSGYTGYMLGDGIPENGAQFGHGIKFPEGPVIGDYFLRTDFLPNRLFFYNGNQWVKREDAVRHTLTNRSTRGTNSRGPYDNTSTYTPNDVVSYNGLMYVAIAETIGEEPSSTVEKWREIRSTQKTTFIDNNNYTTVGDVTIPERQALSKALRPRADF